MLSTQNAPAKQTPKSATIANVRGICGGAPPLVRPPMRNATNADECEQEGQAHLVDDPFPFRTRQEYRDPHQPKSASTKWKPDQHRQG